MKRIIILILTLALTMSLTAQAESPVYDMLTGLIAGREFTLTVSAEADGELADIAVKYGQVICTLRQENDNIVLTVACEGDAYLNACASAEGVSFDTNLFENGTFQSGWTELSPEVTSSEGEISIRMAGPDHELITFSCKVDGQNLTDCVTEVHIGYITGPGNVHSLWDGITTRDGEANREFYFTFSEEEYALEGEGAVTVEYVDGTIIITRDEECTVTYSEDELGTVTFHSVLTIK